MRATVEILLAVGILVNLLKAADMILRPHQQKYVQNKFESLTLRIEYMKPLDWYVHRNVGNTAYWHLFTLLPALVVSGTCFVLILLAKLSIWWLTAPLLYLLLCIIGASFLKLPMRVQNSPQRPTVWLKLSRWVTNAKSLTQLIYRHCLLIAVSLIVILFLSGSFIYWITSSFDNGRPSPWTGTTLLLWMLLMVLVAYSYGIILAGLASLNVLALSLVVVIIELLLKIIRGLTWRIVEYNKGAVAGIILLATIALGIIELYLRYSSLTR